MDNNLLQPLKGFRDFLPEDAKKRSFAIDNIKSTFELYGFEPLETPALEYESLLLGKYGDEADKLIYRFEDEGGRRVALRYDQTVPTARILASYKQQLPMPWKRYQIQPVWRAEKPQRGRFREFFQCDADIYGTTSPLADAEIVALANALFQNLGFRDFKIYINDRNILFDVIGFVKIPPELQFSVIASIDKLDRKSEEEVASELIAKGIDTNTVKHLFELLKTAKPTQKLQEILDLSQNLGVNKERLFFEPRLARGLDYYTSTIFEVKIDDYPAGSVLGGGRYDNLIDTLCSVDIPAVGFALGFDRTIEALDMFGLFPKEKTYTKVLVSVFNKDLADEAAMVAANLRGNGIETEIFPSYEVKLEKQLKYADKKQIPWLVVVGPEEVNKNKVVLKNLNTGKQTEEKLSDLPEKIS